MPPSRASLSFDSFAIIYQQKAQLLPRQHQQSSHLEKLLSVENIRVGNDRDLAGKVSIAGRLHKHLLRDECLPCDPACQHRWEESHTALLRSGAWGSVLTILAGAQCRALPAARGHDM